MFNEKGIFDNVFTSFDEALAGVTVTATDSSGAVVATSISDGTGSYTLNGLSDGSEYRVEFSLPSWLHASGLAGASSTPIEFVDSPSCLNMAAGAAADYCQDDPDVSVTCYVNQDIYSAGLMGQAGLVTDPYSTTDTGTPPTHAETNALVSEIGSAWGLAHKRTTDELFAATQFRASYLLGPGNVGSATGSTGAIYKVNSANNVTVLLDLDPSVSPNPLLYSTGANPRPNSTTNFFCDTAGVNSVGKIGWGDIDISDDEQTLYAMNLFDRSLYKIGPVSGAVISKHPIPGVPGGDAWTLPICAGDPATDIRPFALKFYRGTVYVGAMCSAESTGAAADLRGYVFEFDPVLNTYNPVPATEFPIEQRTGESLVGAFFTFMPWKTDYTAAARGTFGVPYFVDIEFQSGDMILGVTNGHHFLVASDDPLAVDPGDCASRIASNSMGVVYRSCSNGATWDIEVGGVCGGVSGYDTDGMPTSGGITWDSYYRYDNVHSADYHGSLAQHPAMDEFVVPSIFGTNSGFIGFISHSTFERDRDYIIYDNSPIFPSKGLGLGDVELQCDPAPIEIGNRVWVDTDNDGIQDPGELPLAGVTLTLFDLTMGVAVGTAITDADGRYFFGGAGNTNMTMGSVKFGNDYEVRIADSDPGISGYLLTSDNTTTDTIDSDGQVVGSDFVAAVTTGTPGQNDYSLDFGFVLSLSSIGDYVWEDLNMNGLQDAGEPGINGVMVELLDAAMNPILVDFFGNPLMTQTTNDPLTGLPGWYTFPDLAAGDYFVRFTAPNGYTLTSQNSGPDAADSDADLVTGKSPIINLGPNEDNPTIDAGVFLTPDGSASVMWNGFCDQQNFIAMRNVCSSDSVNISLSLFGSTGNLLSTDSLDIPAGGQVDYSVNDMTGFSMFDYGVVELVSSPGGCIDGDMGLFTPIGAGQYFTSAIDNDSLAGLQNLFTFADGSSSNSCYAVFNTFQPSLNPADQGQTTHHWLQLANHEDSKQDFSVNRYDSSGGLVSSRSVSLNPRARLDIAAGHEDSIINRYGLVEVIPNSPGSNYSAELFRYGMDLSTQAGERMSAFSLADNCSVGGRGEQFVSVSRGVGASNWLELQNISANPANVTVDIYSNSAGKVESLSLALAPMQSQHLDATAGLAEGESGVAKIASEGRVLAKGTSYLYRADGRILTAETVEGRGKLGITAAGSFNSFRNQLNWLRLFNVSGSEVEISIAGYDQTGGISRGESSVKLAPNSGQDINLNALFQLTGTEVGRVELNISAPGSVVADIIRVQHDPSFSQVKDIECFLVE